MLQATKAELPHQRLDEGCPLVEVWMLQLENDGDVRADGDRGIVRNNGSSRERSHGATKGRAAGG